MDGRHGTVGYLLREPQPVEAILYGLARNHKFLAASQFDRADRDAFHPEVKRAVWDRVQRNTNT